MLEKSGVILLTKADFLEYQKGQVSDRLKDTWGIATFEDLKRIIESNQYEIL